MEGMDYSKIVLKQLVGNNLKLEPYLNPYIQMNGVVKWRAQNKIQKNQKKEQIHIFITLWQGKIFSTFKPEVETLKKNILDLTK